MELNRIYNMDCVEGMKLLDESSVDLTVTSPPYDNLRNYNGFTLDIEGVIKELYRITKEGGTVVWIVGDATKNGSETGTSFKQALMFMNNGFKLHDTMIYQKVNPTPSKSKRYQNCFEYMFVFVKGKIKTFNPIMVKKKYIENRKVKHYNKDVDGKQISHSYKSISDMKIAHNIWQYKVGLHHTTKDKIAFKHPAIFPDKLASDHILSWSNENDLVLDIFMGSGTTATQCVKHKRNYIGFELSEEYCEIAKSRLHNINSELLVN